MIKFSESKNPSKAIWKASASAEEQEVYAINYRGSYAWAKPYKLYDTPYFLDISGSAGNKEFLSASEIEWECVATDYGHGAAFYGYTCGNRTGVEMSITIRNGGSKATSVFVAFSAAYWEMLDRGSISTEQITNNTAAYKWGDHPVALVTASEDVSLELVYQDTIYWHVNGEYKKLGKGFYIVTRAHVYKEQGYEWASIRIPIMLNTTIDYSYGYNGLYVPISSDTSGIGIKFDDESYFSTSGPYNLESRCTRDSVYIQRVSSGSMRSASTILTFSFAKNTLDSTGGVVKRTLSLEPSAPCNTNPTSDDIVKTGSIVYWGDVLKTYSGSSLVDSRTLDEIDEYDDYYSSDGFLYTDPWGWDPEEIYPLGLTNYNITSFTNDSFPLGAFKITSAKKYYSWAKGTCTEWYYDDSDHKNSLKNTINISHGVVGQNQYVRIPASYATTAGWDGEVTQYRFFNKKKQTFSLDNPAITSGARPKPTITASVVNNQIKFTIKNNASYNGTYYLNFKVYYNNGNSTASRSHSAPIKASETLTYTTSFSYSNVVGVSGSGQFYYVGLGSSSVTFTAGNTGGNQGGGDVCLIKNTPILMADYTTKPIQDIVVGDEILGYDFENNCTIPTVVMYSTPTKLQQQANYVVFDNNEVLCLTKGHVLYSVEHERCIPIDDFREGMHCLDESGSEVEVLAIHTDVELKSYETFYHIISSNNTYFANGIMNSGASIDKYRYIHDLRGENIPRLIEPIIWDESKDVACFNFTVTNKEFLVKGTPFQSKIKKTWNKIWDLEKRISETNPILKTIAGLDLTGGLTKGLEELYNQIDEYKAQIKNWESEYNKLLADYSDIGEDILLSDQDRRKKYFKRANKIANDNFELYKQYYPREELNLNSQVIAIQDNV